MEIQFANNAKGKLNAGITNVQTNLVLQGGQGALFPTTATGKFYKATLIDSSGNVEVIHVTTHTAANDTFSVIVRGQEGTTPRAFLAGDKVELRATKGIFEALVQESPVESIVGDEALDYADFNTTKIVTASANITLPATTAFSDGDFIDFKSITTGNVRITPNGADTIDGVNALYRLPSFCICRLMRIAAGQWALVRRPEVEIGEVKFWPVNSANPPTGWLFSDNVTISRSTFAGLFAVYDVIHGVGDGATTFGKADMRGRLPIGRDDMGGAAANRVNTANGAIDGATIGASGGQQNRTITVTELPASGLTIPALTGSITSLVVDKTLGDPGPINAFMTTEAVDDFGDLDVTTGLVSSVIATVANTTGNMGAGGALKTLPPGLVGNWIVKT